jgi:ubiquinone/menaquinone biosynthesis C-methylase UbiE
MKILLAGKEDTEKSIKRFEKQREVILTELEKGINLKSELKNSKVHLDFGCGYGNFAFVSSKHFPKLEILGVDLDRDVIKAAKMRYSSKKLKFSTRIPDKKVDSVSIVHVLHELRGNLQKTLKRIYLVMGKNGKIIVYDYQKTSREEFKKLFKKRGWSNSFDEEYKEHNKWTIKQFQKIMEDAGFRTIQIKPSRKYWLMYVGEKRVK